MSRSSISAIVDGLIREGRIHEGQIGESTSHGGRRPIMLYYRPRAMYALGIDVGATKTIAIVTDLDGTIVAKRKFSSHGEGEIGAGLIINGQIYRGRGGSAGEIGHLHIDAFTKRPKLDFEGFGPLEQVSSGKGIEDSMGRTDETLTTADVFELATQGEPLAMQVMQNAIQYMAFSIANMVTLLNPDMVILGGGVSNAGDQLLYPLRARVSELSAVPCNLVLAKLGEDAAALGAAATVLIQADELRLTGFEDINRLG